MFFFIRYFFIIIVFLLNFSSLKAAEKVVFIDIDFVLNNSNLGKIIYKDLENLNKKNLEFLSKKEKIINEKKNAINKTKNVASKEKLENDIKLFNQDVEKYKKEKNDLLNEFKKTKDVKLQSFLKDINPLIQDYMKKNSIDIILEKNQIFIGNINKDITDDIIKLINNNFSNNG